MKTITLENAIKLIKSTDGRMFSVGFTKKDGTHRDMNCRLGVAKHLKGGELAYDPQEYDLLTVYDMKSQGYRMISTQTLKTVKVGGEAYQVV